MEDKSVMQILELLETLQDACPELYKSAVADKSELFERLCGDVKTGLGCILNMIDSADTEGNKKLRMIGQSALDSLKRTKNYYPSNLENCLKKIEFELLPLLQEAHASYYFFQYLTNHPEHLEEYEKKEKKILYGNTYINESVKTNKYKYEVSIIITGYNKLEYTKFCVESLLANMPAELNYELILVNHGSSDGTKEYFESIHPHKQLDIAVNGGGVSALGRIVEGKFVIWISNDVVIMPGTIENLLACIRSDPKIIWAVPATPNVSNLQAIPAQYTSRGEMLQFARKNNQQDSFRWEQRVRLCNPIDIRRSSEWYCTSGLGLQSSCIHPLYPGHPMNFPDDRISLLIRRNGYKMMLVKDAYCHHFGSVTLKSEVQKYGEQKYYADGRQDFAHAFGVDPWGIGFCFDLVFMGRVVGDHTGHVDVLGINCGLGSNSLKIKEQIKEYCHNTDVYLTNLTSAPEFLRDLAGISDEAKTINSFKGLAGFLSGKRFHYIVWEAPLPAKTDEQSVVRILKNALYPAGQLFKKDMQSTHTGWKQLGNGWYCYVKE